jgi:hypothetical protein
MSERANRIYEKAEIEKTITIDDIRETMSGMLRARRTNSTALRRPNAGISPVFQSADSQNKKADSSMKKEKSNSSNDSSSRPNENEEVALEEDEKGEDERDDGVTDEDWASLITAKEQELSRTQEIAREQEEYARLVAEKEVAEEKFRRQYEAEVDRIRQEKELEEKEKQIALREAEEAERQRKHAAEVKMKKREDEERKRIEELERLTRVKAKLQQIGRCPAGFNWHHSGGGWRCGGGSHWVSDEELKRKFGYDV